MPGAQPCAWFGHFAGKAGGRTRINDLFCQTVSQQTDNGGEVNHAGTRRGPCNEISFLAAAFTAGDQRTFNRAPGRKPAIQNRYPVMSEHAHHPPAARCRLDI